MSTESPRSLECAHVNEGTMEGHHVEESITFLLLSHDDFTDFLMKLLKTKQNMRIK